MSNSSKIVIVNYASLEGATVSASTPSVGDYFAKNLVSVASDLTFKTPQNITNVDLTTNLQRERQVGFFGLFGHNLSVSAILRYRLFQNGELVFSGTLTAHDAIYSPYERTPYSTRPYGLPIGDELDALYFHTTEFFENVLADKVVISIEDPANLEGEIRAGYLMVGAENIASDRVQYGSGVNFNIDANVSRQSNGAVFGRYDVPNQSVSINFGQMTTNQQSALRRAVRFAQQTNTPMFSSFFSEIRGAERQQHELLSFITSMTGPRKNDADLYDAQINAIEVIL